MSYNPTLRAFTGEDGRRIWTTARQVLCDELAARVTESFGQDVFVTFEATAASRESKKNLAPPVVFILRGKRRRTPSGRSLPDGTFIPGHRNELEFRLDCATNTPDINDSELVDALCEAVEENAAAFAALGLKNIAIEADQEAQNAGNGRNPHRLTCLAITLPGYEAPSTP